MTEPTPAALDQAIRAKLRREFDAAFANHWSEYQDAVEAVLDLHAVTGTGPYVYCNECREGLGYDAGHADWPCPTVRAIAEKLGVDVPATA
jgi:hypothetical protein